MFRFFFLIFALTACSKADHQSAGSKIPAPGFSHLPQVYVLLDSDAPEALGYSFLSALEVSIPNAKRYVARPVSREQAQEQLRSWSARSMDWLVIAGPVAREAFFETKVSWTGAARVLVIAPETKTATLGTELQAKTTTLLSKSQVLRDWTLDYCKKSQDWPECRHQEKAIFAWAHDLESSPGALVEVDWSWPMFLSTVKAQPAKTFEFSFRDGFLTLKLRSRTVKDKALETRLGTWIKTKALAGLGSP